MKNKLLAWFKVNKILIPFILLSLAVWIVVPLSLMPRPEQVEEDIPIVEIGRFDLETGDAILLYQKGDNLVAHFEQTVHHSDGDVRDPRHRSMGHPRYADDHHVHPADAFTRADIHAPPCGRSPH